MLIASPLSADILDFPGVYLVKASVRKVTKIIRENEASIIANKPWLQCGPPMTEVALQIEEVLHGSPELLGKPAYHLEDYNVYPPNTGPAVSPFEFGEVGIFLVKFKEGYWHTLGGYDFLYKTRIPCIQWRDPAFEELLRYCIHRRDHPEPGLSSEGKRLAPVVIATVEKVSLNQAGSMKGQGRRGIAPVYRVQLSVTEVLRGPQSFKNGKVFTLTRKVPAPFDLFNYLPAELQPGDECLFALYQETDGYWYDIGLGSFPRDPKDPWYGFPARAFRRLQPDYASIVGILRDLRDHPDKKVPQITPPPPVPQPPVSSPPHPTYPLKVRPELQPSKMPVVLAKAEQMALNDRNAVGGQSHPGEEPVYRLQLRITEVLLGPQDLLGQTAFSLLKAQNDLPFTYLSRPIMPETLGIFALIREQDGYWYDMDLVDPRETGLIRHRHFNDDPDSLFAMKLVELRNLRENENIHESFSLPDHGDIPPPVKSWYSWAARWGAVAVVTMILTVSIRQRLRRRS